MKDAEKSLRSFKAVNYGEIIQLADGVKVRFQDAGTFWDLPSLKSGSKRGRGEKIIFSGD